MTRGGNNLLIRMKVRVCRSPCCRLQTEKGNHELRVGYHLLLTLLLIHILSLVSKSPDGQHEGNSIFYPEVFEPLICFVNGLTLG